MIEDDESVAVCEEAGRVGVGTTSEEEADTETVPEGSETGSGDRLEDVEDAAAVELDSAADDESKRLLEASNIKEVKLSEVLCVAEMAEAIVDDTEPMGVDTAETTLAATGTTAAVPLG